MLAAVEEAVSTSSHFQHSRSLPPPCVYEGRLSYADQWKEHRHQIHQYSSSSSSSLSQRETPAAQVIFDLALIHDTAVCANDNSGSAKPAPAHLVGCTGSGELCIWSMPPPLSRASDSFAVDTMDLDDSSDDVDTIADQVLSTRVYRNKPLCRLRVGGVKQSPTTTGPSAGATLYSVQVVAREEDGKHWLVAAGNGGVWLYLWEDDIRPLVPSLDDEQDDPLKQKPQELSTRTLFVAPRAHFSLHPSACESEVEVNDTCLHAGCLYGAAGDAFGCYKWDLSREQLVTTYQSPTTATSSKNDRPAIRGYLQAVQKIPNSNLLLTGGHEGLLGIWDMDKDQAVDHIDMSEVLSGTGGGAPPITSRRQTSPVPMAQQHQHHIWISSIVARDENWWTIAGGTSSTSSAASSSSSNAKNGFVSTWHGPTRSIVSFVETRERPQKLALCGESSEAVISVANESFVSHYEDSLSLSPSPVRVWCDAPSAYAVEVASDGRIVVSGVGGIANIYEGRSQLTATLRL